MANKILIRLKPIDRLEIPNFEISSSSHETSFWHTTKSKRAKKITSQMIYIDVGDGCWRSNVLVTSLLCW